MERTPDLHTDKTQKKATHPRQTLANLLKDGRKSKGISLKKIAKATGIGLGNLQALEAGNRRGLPADVFVRGFIRMYSAQVGVDSQVALDLFEREWGVATSTSNESTALLQGEAFAKSSLLLRCWPTVVTILISCGIVYLAAIYFFPALFVVPTQPIGETLSDKLPEIKIITKTQGQARTDISPTAGILATDQTADPELENPATETASTIKNTKESKPGSQEQGFNPTDQPEEKSVKPAATKIIHEELKPTEDLIATEPPESTGDVLISDTLKEATHYTLHIEFTERTWVKFSIDGQPPQEEIFRQGSEQTWDADENIDLYLGNAGGVKITLNDKPVPLKQESGQTVRLQIP